jgi:K319-like protein
MPPPDRGASPPRRPGDPGRGARLTTLPSATIGTVTRRGSSPPAGGWCERGSPASDPLSLRPLAGLIATTEPSHAAGPKSGFLHRGGALSYPRDWGDQMTKHHLLPHAFALGLALLAQLGWSVRAEAESVEVTVSVTGSLHDYWDLRGARPQERWTIDSQFTQSGNLAVNRSANGEITGGHPNPNDKITHQLTGELKFYGCINRSFALKPPSYEMKLPAGVTLPPGVNLPKSVMSPERGRFHFAGCKANGRLLAFYLPPPGVYEIPETGDVICPDGVGSEEYSRRTVTQYPQPEVEERLRAEIESDLKAECPGEALPELDGADSSDIPIFLGSADWGDLVQGGSLTFTKNHSPSIEISGGANSASDHYEQSIKLEVTIQLVSESIRAEPGSYSISRGETVTLDGAKSRPSKGHRITSYEWTLTAVGCPSSGRVAKASGARVSFKALCDVEAKLKVKDDGGKSDERTGTVSVKARAWKSVLTTDAAVVKKSLGFSPPNFSFGFNRCKTHPDADPDHYFHRVGNDPFDYENGTFWLAQVQDEGPFAGLWYVSKGDFTIPRIKIVNLKFYPGGAVYEHKRPDGSDQHALVDRLRRSLEFHEAQHSALAARALAAMSDPARAIEQGMDSDREDLKEAMNRPLIVAYTELSEASSDEKVHAAMRAVIDFVPGGTIYFPAYLNEAAGSRTYTSFAEIGD